jgi:hypothetical protein
MLTTFYIPHKMFSRTPRLKTTGLVTSKAAGMSVVEVLETDQETTYWNVSRISKGSDRLTELRRAV